MSMLRKLVEWFASKLSAPRVIMDRENGTPYLSRYYLFSKPRMPDGSYPYTSTGNPKPGIIWPEGNLKFHLHKFHRGDSDLALHNHPWKWALSFVLVGGYREEKLVLHPYDGVLAKCEIIERIVKPFSFNLIRDTDFHRVDLIEEDAWTLFITGPRVKSWGFWDRDTATFTPWREFLARKREINTEPDKPEDPSPEPKPLKQFCVIVHRSARSEEQVVEITDTQVRTTTTIEGKRLHTHSWDEVLRYYCHRDGAEILQREINTVLGSEDGK